MRKKTLLLFALTALLIVPLAAISAQEGTTVGLVLPQSEESFYQNVYEALSAANPGDYTLNLVYVDGDAEAELAAVSGLLDEGVDAVLLYPVDAEDSAATVEAVNAAGVPLFLLGADVERGEDDMALDVAALLKQDDLAAGEMAGEFFCESLEGEGTVVVLAGLPQDDAEDDDMAADDDDGESGDEELPVAPDVAALQAQIEGLTTYLAENCAGVTVIVEETETYANADSLVFLEGLLEDGTVATGTGVFASNAELTIEALQAARSARVRALNLITLESTGDTIDLLEGQRISAIIEMEPAALAQLTMDTVSAYLAGEPLDASVFADLLLYDSDSATELRCTLPDGTPCSG